MVHSKVRYCHGESTVACSTELVVRSHKASEDANIQLTYMYALNNYIVHYNSDDGDGINASHNSASKKFNKMFTAHRIIVTGI